MLGRTTRTLREWANKGRIERRYGDDNKVYYRIETPRNERGKGGSKREVNAEMHPELFRQVAGERGFLREQRVELILQLSRKDEEIRECRRRLDSLAERGMERSEYESTIDAPASASKINEQNLRRLQLGAIQPTK